MEKSYVGYIGEYLEIRMIEEQPHEILFSLGQQSILPKGLSFNASNKIINGYPQELYRQTITLIKKDLISKEEGIETFLIVIKEARQLTLLTTEIPAITAGLSFTYKFEYRGGAGLVAFSSDTLPDGLILSKDGNLSGIALVGGGMFPLSIIIKDEQDHQVTKAFRLHIHNRRN